MPLVPSMKEMNAGVIGVPSANEMSTGVKFGVPNANEVSIGVRSQLLLPKRHKRSDKLRFFYVIFHLKGSEPVTLVPNFSHVYYISSMFQK